MSPTVHVTTPGDREVAVTRVFDAPRSLVFDCHTQPELVRRWLLGPDGWSMPVCEIDLRVGSDYRYVWRNDAKGQQFGMDGTYREIVAPERIVFVERFNGDESLCTLVLTEAGGRTTLSQTMRFSTPDERDHALKSGMTDGMSTSYDRLERVMEEHRPAVA
jgi:uncharacterized protein YndB with AHSA1/START domain